MLVSSGRVMGHTTFNDGMLIALRAIMKKT
jgi:hypothetical protein